MADINKIIPIIKHFEGGFVKDKVDKGGATNIGVTLTTYRSVYGKSKTEADLKNMTDEQFKHILRYKYWDKASADNINNQSIANLIVDFVWHSGLGVLKKIQRVLQTFDSTIKVDGVFGVKTISAINKADQKALFNAIKTYRGVFLEGVIKSNAGYERYRKGFANRLNYFKFEP